MEKKTIREYYPALDALRFVAAVMVLGYHLFEAVAFAAGEARQMMFHGFLAVDFFLILSGFVMGQAYDREWEKMSVGSFLKKRLIRLHPMVVLGVIVGLTMFVLQGCRQWDGTVASSWRVALSVLLALLMLPSPTSVDVRGNTEMFPLNGPHWSLFFEYIGSLLYALLLRKLPTKALKIWVLTAALALLAMGLYGPDGSIAYGWSSRPVNMLGGLLRMTFALLAGLLLARLFSQRRPSALPAWVAITSAVTLVGLLCIPFIGETPGVFYQVGCVAIAFPAIIWFGGRSCLNGRSRICKSLGGMSYTLYAVHYPFIYMYIGWINEGSHPFGEAWWATPLAISLTCLLTAFLSYKFYDKPLRKKLSEKFCS